MMRLGALLAAIAPMLALAAPIEVVDDSGRRVRLERPAARIVTLAPSLAEFVVAAGAESRLVGVAVATELARPLPVVAQAGSVDFEAIARLQPDLVVAWRSGNPARSIERLATRGHAVFIAEPARLDDVPRLLRALGVLAGSAATAEASAREFEQAIASLPRAARPVRVFVEIWHAPLMTVGGAHLISALVRRCGGVNIFADAPGLAPAIALEALLARDADLIVANAAIDALPAAEVRWARARQVRAIADRRIVSIDPRELHSQSPRLARVARELCGAIAAAAAG